jgi:peptide/nickel transport system ATP-binding protein
MIRELKDRLNTAMLLITHDLGVVAQNCDRVAIIYAGEIVEIGTLQHIFKEAKHPYTLGLLGSIPSLTKNVKRLSPIKGLMPDPTDLPPGCKFYPRCKFAEVKCNAGVPPLYEVSEGHWVRCILCNNEEITHG